MKLSESAKNKLQQIVSYLFIVLFVYASVSKLLEFQDFQTQLGQSPLLGAFALPGCKSSAKSGHQKIKTNPVRSVLKNTVELAIHTTSNETDFKKQLIEQGINTVVRRNESGRIYGITFIDHESRSIWNGSQLDRSLSANMFNNWRNNGNKPELKVQESPVSNTDTLDHQPTKDLFEFISHEHLHSSDL